MTDPNGLIRPGRPAPDFTLPATPDGRRTGLREYRDRPVVLAFYPADWSPVCGDQMALYQSAMPEFESYRAALLGISVDSFWSHRAFAENQGVEFPLLSDFEPKGAVARSYGAYTRGGEAARALVVIDPDGVVAWCQLYPQEVNPGADGILDALERMRVGGEVRVG
ncbi:redoxin domain-containing protein [Micromonospora azadirachtae]|uniref:Redoxin domain-containing protein n=1 Tax=Micromonospora azadirachtae TaxID=1970735 RepID=A0ABW2ZZR2_9ACTN